MFNKCKEANEIWKELEVFLGGTEEMKDDHADRLYDEFEEFKTQPDETLYAYYKRYKTLLNNVRATEITLSLQQINSKFLHNLPAHWEPFIVNLKVAQKTSKLTLDQVYTACKKYEGQANLHKTSATRDHLAYAAQTDFYSRSTHPYNQQQHVTSHVVPPPQQPYPS